MLSTERPKNITIIIAMLILLAVVSTVSAATTRIGFGAPNRQFNQNGANQFQNNGGTNPNFQGNNGNFTGGNFQGQNGSTRRFTAGFNLFSISRTLGISGPYLIYVSLAFTIIGIILLLLSAYGVWKSKLWGLNLGMVMALIFLVGALPSLFSIGGRNFNWLRTGLNLVSLVATLPVLALSMLPSVRDFFPKAKKK